MRISADTETVKQKRPPEGTQTAETRLVPAESSPVSAFSRNIGRRKAKQRNSSHTFSSRRNGGIERVLDGRRRRLFAPVLKDSKVETLVHESANQRKWLGESCVRNPMLCERVVVVALKL